MQNIYACIDGRVGTQAVIDGATWAARRLCAPLQFLHVLQRHTEQVDRAEYSGAIGIDAQDELLQELTDIDHRCGHLMQEAGRLTLAAAEVQARQAGTSPLKSLLRHGTLSEAAVDLELSARLFVAGH